jgi:hypothetical protein
MGGDSSVGELRNRHQRRARASTRRARGVYFIKQRADSCGMMSRECRLKEWQARGSVVGACEGIVDGRGS